MINKDVVIKIIYNYTKLHMSKADAGVEFNISEYFVNKILKENNIQTRTRQENKIIQSRKRHKNCLLTLDKELEIVELYNLNLSSSNIAKQFGISATGICNILKRHNCKIKNASQCHRKLSLIENIFDNIDSEEKAYWLGLFAADGYNSKNKKYVTITAQSSDKHHLFKISKFMFKNEKDIHICDYVRKEKYKESVIRYHSKYLSQKISDLGFPNKKSLTLKYPECIPKHLESHFIRGFFDGDGSLIYNKRNKQFSVKFTGGRAFVASVRNIISQISMTNGHIYSHKNVDSVTFSGNVSVTKILKYLYKDCFIYLDRKFEKAKFLLSK
jgi:intein-encoded DNA endonuclease-like protein